MIKGCNSWIKNSGTAEGGKTSVVGWVHCVLDFNHLCLRILRAHAGCSQLDHLSELGDGLGWGMGSLSQFFLTGCSPSNQQLGVLHQCLGCLQDALPEGRDTSCHNLLHTHTRVAATWKDAAAILTERLLMKNIFSYYEKYGAANYLSEWVIKREMLVSYFSGKTEIKVIPLKTN